MMDSVSGINIGTMAAPPTITSRLLWKTLVAMGVITLLAEFNPASTYLMATFNGIVMVFIGGIIYLAIQMREGKLALNPAKPFGLQWKK